METAAEKIHREIEAEKRDIRIGALLTLLTFSGLVTGIICQLANAPVWSVAVAFIIAYLAGGVPATIEALATLKERSLDINLLMILAALAAAGVGEARDGAILLFLFSLAGTLEAYAMGNTKRAVAALLSLRPDEANLLASDGTTTRVSVESLAIGAHVIVRPGERIPVDGVVINGEGAVDQSPVTGESVPVDRSLGDSLFAGSVNKNSVLTVEVTKLAHQSTLARMIDLVTEAQEKRSPSEHFSDWFGERYTVVVLVGSLTALVIFILVGLPYDTAFYKAATLLVVASPCAIVISVPAAILSALAAAAKSGVLFKGGAALEEFGSATIIALDKTGTLTQGVMRVTDVVGLRLSEDEILAIAVGLESHSDHPLARSITEYGTIKNVSLVPMEQIVIMPGKGVRAESNGESYFAGNRKMMLENNQQFSDEFETIIRDLEIAGKTVVIIGKGDELLGVIVLADTIRPSAEAALAELRRQGATRFVLLSGDSQRVVDAVGGTLSFEKSDMHGDLLPEDKVAIINELRKEGKVAFVGDGVNDAAALATAHVGVAMGVAGSDVAIEAADVALLSDDLVALSYTSKLAKTANRIIKQNLMFAVGIMLLMIVVTTFWYLPLPLGVIGHEGGTLLVVANGLRLLFMVKK